MIRFLQSGLTLSLICLAAGALSSFAMAPYNKWFALLIGFSTLYIALNFAKGPKQAFMLVWSFGFGYFGLSLYWIGNALLVEGNDYTWAWPLAVTALPAGLALFPAIAGALFRFAGTPLKISSLLVFVILMAAAELARGHLFTGFPWNLYGYTWAGTPEILQSVSQINIYGLTALTILWAALPGFWALRLAAENFNLSAAIFTLLVIASFGFLFSYGDWRLQNARIENHKNITLRLVQPNIPQSEKWDRTKMQSHFETLNRLSRADGDEREITYIIWPETALSPAIMRRIQNRDILQDTLSSYRGNAYLLTGALRFEPQTGGYFNSLLFFDQTARNTQIYDKAHLVPFGEYIPFQDIIPLKTVTNFEGFQKGPGPDHLKTPEGLSYSPLVCYEIIFPGRVTARKSATPPDFIVNVTNDAWYGKSAGPHQHLTKAVFRAVEEGIPVIRVANTGISALIDPFGNIRIQSELFTPSSQTSLLPIRNNSRLGIYEFLKALF